MLYDEGDIKTIKWGGKYLDKTLGQDPEKIKAMSPVHQAEKLEAPIIIVSGKEDQRAPIEHAYALADALEKAGKEHELIIVEKEGHGFRKPEKEIYIKAAKVAKSKPDECFFIDDLRDNIQVAKEVGFRGVHFKSYEKLVTYLKKEGVF